MYNTLANAVVGGWRKSIAYLQIALINTHIFMISKDFVP
jgi:hypothetical protein